MTELYDILLILFTPIFATLLWIAYDVHDILKTVKDKQKGENDK